MHIEKSGLSTCTTCSTSAAFLNVHAYKHKTLESFNTLHPVIFKARTIFFEMEKGGFTL